MIRYNLSCTILALTSNFESFGFDKLDHFQCGLGDIGHIFTMRVLSQEAGGTDDDIPENH